LYHSAVLVDGIRRTLPAVGKANVTAFENSGTNVTLKRYVTENVGKLASLTYLSTLVTNNSS